MKLIAINTVNRGVGKSVAPGGEFEIDDKDEAQALIDAGAASRKTKTVADDDDILPLTEVLALAEKEGVSFATFKSAASKHLTTVPAKKDDIVAALLVLPPEQPSA